MDQKVFLRSRCLFSIVPGWDYWAFWPLARPGGTNDVNVSITLLRPYYYRSIRRSIQSLKESFSAEDVHTHETKSHVRFGRRNCEAEWTDLEPKLPK